MPTRRRPATAGPSRRTGEGQRPQLASSSSNTDVKPRKKERPQTAGRWGYGVSESSSKRATRNRLGRGVSQPITTTQSRPRRRRPRPHSSHNPNNQSRPEFDAQYMSANSNQRPRRANKQSRKPRPSYTVKYLGISRGEIGILSRKINMSSGTRSRPRNKVNINIPTMHRAPKYRLDPDIVTLGLRKRHDKNQRRPSTAPHARPETGTDELDNGVTPCPDLYDSWKIPFSKQPTLLSGGGFSSNTMFNNNYTGQGGGPGGTGGTGGQRHHHPEQQHHFKPPLLGGWGGGQRPATATGMRRRRKGAQDGNAGNVGNAGNTGNTGNTGNATRPSTAPPTNVRDMGGAAVAAVAGNGSEQEDTTATDFDHNAEQGVTPGTGASLETLPTLPTGTVDGTVDGTPSLLPTNGTTGTNVTNVLPASATLSNDALVTEQLRRVHLEEEEDRMRQSRAFDEVRRGCFTVLDTVYSTDTFSVFSRCSLAVLSSGSAPRGGGVSTTIATASR